MSSPDSQHKEKSRIALTSVIAAVFLTAMKSVVGLMTGSLGILSEAAHSGLDLLAALITLFAVRIADRPADKDHLYGHGKVENFSALIETIILIVTCGWIIYEAIERLLYKTVHIEVNVWSFAVIIVAIIVDISRSRALYRVARKYHSQALEADALHFSSDVWSSSVVIVGLIFTLLGFPIGDAIAALLVALLVIVVSLRLGKRTIDALMDRMPLGLYEKLHEVAMAVPGVKRCGNIRLRQSGSKTFADMYVWIKRTLPFEQAHNVVTGVEKQIETMLPNIDVVIHAEPLATEDESITDKVKVIVANYGMSPHEIEVNRLNGTQYLELHLEYSEINFEKAHEIATQIERDIQQQIPTIAKVRIHLEDMTADIQELRDVTASSGAAIRKIRKLALRESEVIGCDDIIVMESGGKLKVTMNCQLRRDLTLAEVHSIITTIEHKIYKSMKDIAKVTIHAEPVPQAE
jgi:cation diffusion facilitator family transporter